MERDGFEERGEALESPNVKARLPRGSQKRRVDSDDEDEEEAPDEDLGPAAEDFFFVPEINWVSTATRRRRTWHS